MTGHAMAGRPATRGVLLPGPDGGLTRYHLSALPSWRRPHTPLTSRVAYAAAHVVADPLGDNVPGAPAAVDWDATLAVRRDLWSWGLGVADAMDTAQRGMGLDWAATRELVRRSAAEARAVGGRIACGAGTDHAPTRLRGLDEVVAAYLEQVEVVEASGATVVLMASRQLAGLARSAEEYATVYGRVLSQVSRPVILHWLGSVFDPALHGYWGGEDPAVAADTVLAIIREHAPVVDGIKVSVLDAEVETALRRRLPAGVRLYTGDDFNYPELILGTAEERGSDALLGVFAAIAPAASAALQALDQGDVAGYHAALDPTLGLARHLFAAPTPYYKTGIAFLSWLSGRQAGFGMVGGMQAARSPRYLAEAYRLADQAGVLPDPDLAAARMRRYLDVMGIPQ